MKDIYCSKKYLFLICIISLLVISCGGGSAGDVRNDGGNTDDTTDGNVNGGLTGRIFVNNENSGVMVDISTGRATQMPSINWEQTGDYNASTSFSAVPNKIGTLFLLTAFDCEYHPEDNSGFRERDCLLIVDIKGNVVKRQVYSEGIGEGSKLSNDDEYIAFMYMDEPHDSSPNAELHIVDKEFQQITGSFIKHSSGYNSGLLWRNFDWTNDNEIVYGYDDSIFITPAYNSLGSHIYTIPTADNNDHFVTNPVVSPDGTKIAFRYMTDSNYSIKQGNVWVMNIDGTDPHRLVYTPNYEAEDGSTVVAYQVYNDHAWSPDGKYIMVMEGGTSGDLVSGPDGASNSLYAVPSESRDVPLNENGEHGIVHIRSYFFDSSRLTFHFEPYSGEIKWVP
ncbi:MAG: hypothetical protein P8101_21475 [Candidatus Thiodiazotropha sp.]